MTNQYFSTLEFIIKGCAAYSTGYQTWKEN